ncbi:MAG TPA: asparagine synthase-related protein, partial [Deinococcales bacterium]|nr:asparagine synthase-related protein [Deinococcales bacterium]
ADLSGIVALGLPLLALGSGADLLLSHAGSPAPAERLPGGLAEIRVDAARPLFSGLTEQQQVLLEGGVHEPGAAPGFTVAARLEDGTPAAFISEERRTAALLFHPEADLTENGMQMLQNFLERLAGLDRNYVLEDRIETALGDIREQVGDRPVFALVSGGVDSAVTAALLSKALPANQVHALHVDTGFMRKDESAGVVRELRAMGLENLRHVEAGDRFFDGRVEAADGTIIGPLTELFDPEVKRELVGNMFMEVLRDELQELDFDFDTAFFAQGTLRPDLIESGNPDVSEQAQNIKTHHNDVPAVRRAREEGRVVETNADWHKDEVRQVARDLGLSEEIASRQPFPGPGLVLRVMTWDGSDTVPEDLDGRISRRLGRDGGELELRTFPIRSVGVDGDARSYRFLTFVAPGDLTDPALNRAGQLIAGGFQEVNRVAAVLAGRAPLGALQAWPSTIDRGQVDLLREVDAFARTELHDMPSSQMFCLVLPLGTEAGRCTVALRSIITNDYMTGRHTRLEADYPAARLRAWAEAVLDRFPAVDAVVYDITGKPPATVEWQ